MVSQVQWYGTLLYLGMLESYVSYPTGASSVSLLVLFYFGVYPVQVPITRNEIGSCTKENNTSAKSSCQKASANHQLRQHITREKNMLSWKIFVIFFLFHFLLLIQAYCTLAAETPRRSLSCCRLEQNGFFHFEALV